MNYLKKLLYAGLGSRSSDGAREEPNKARRVQPERPNQNAFPLFTALDGSQNRLEETEFDHASADFSEETSTRGEPRMDNDGQRASAAIMSDKSIENAGTHRERSSSTIETKKETEPNNPAALGIPGSALERKGTRPSDKATAETGDDRHGNDELKMKTAQSERTHRIPTVEVVKHQEIQVPHSDQPGTKPNNPAALGIPGSALERKRTRPSDKTTAETGDDRHGNDELKMKTAQSERAHRIPTVEVVKHHEIQVPHSDQPASPRVSFAEKKGNAQEGNGRDQFQQDDLPSPEKTEASKRVHPQAGTLPLSGTEKQKAENRPMMASQGAVGLPKKQNTQEDFSRNLLKTVVTQRLRTASEVFESGNAGRPNGVQTPVTPEKRRTSRGALNDNVLAQSLKAQQAQIAKLARDIAFISQKLEASMDNERSKSAKPVFLAKRPPSRNLGGWSELERTFVR